MTRTQGSPSIHFDSRLMEESVLLRLEGDRAHQAFREVRDRIYEVTDPDQREKSFEHLHRDWFLRLGLAEPFEHALEEQPLLYRSIRACHVGTAGRRRDEGADLYGPAPQVLGLRLMPSSLLQPGSLTAFLRHELLHLADIVDPVFGYRRELPGTGLGPAHDNLIRERYRVLWDTWIDGRMLRRGWAGPKVRSARREEFARAFSMLGEGVEGAFHHWFASDYHSHPEMMAFARNPGPQTGRPEAGGRCPLCHLPSFERVSGRQLAEAVVREIRADAPDWDPDRGLCPQCAELYRSRPVSRRDLAGLPG